MSIQINLIISAIYLWKLYVINQIKEVLYISSIHIPDFNNQVILQK